MSTCGLFLWGRAFKQCINLLSQCPGYHPSWAKNYSNGLFALGWNLTHSLSLKLSTFYHTCNFHALFGWISLPCLKTENLYYWFIFLLCKGQRHRDKHVFIKEKQTFYRHLQCNAFLISRSLSFLIDRAWYFRLLK